MTLRFEIAIGVLPSRKVSAAPLYLDCFFRAYRIFKVFVIGVLPSRQVNAAPLYLRSHYFLPNFFSS